MSIKDKYYRNVGIPFASFISGDPGDYSTDDAGNEYWTANGTTWTQIASLGSRNVHLKSTSFVPDVFDEQIYSGNGVGSQITTGGLEHYQFWMFHVHNVAVNDEITVQISLDGVNFIKPAIIDVMTGALLEQASANITASGIYVFGTNADQATRVALGVKSIKVDRSIATAAKEVIVQGRGV